jgi:hypothetical protein
MDSIPGSTGGSVALKMLVGEAITGTAGGVGDAPGPPSQEARPKNIHMPRQILIVFITYSFYSTPKVRM